MDFPKTFSLTENQFSRKTYLYTIHPCACSVGRPLLHLGRRHERRARHLALVEGLRVQPGLRRKGKD